MKQVIVLILCLLLPQLANAATKITALGITAEEVAVWNQRRVSGPYRVAGDVSTNSPDDWTRILGNADALVSSPTSDRWDGTGFSKSGTCNVPGNEPGPGSDRSLGDRTRDAAFAHLLTGTTSYLTVAKANLLYEAGLGSLNFSDTSIWCIGQLWDINPFFDLAHWLVKLVLAYDYIRPSLVNAGPNQDSGAVSTLDTWFLNMGVFWEAVVTDQTSFLYVTRNDLSNFTLSGNGVTYSNTLGVRTYCGGPFDNNLSGKYQNRMASFVKLFGQIGVMLNNTNLKTKGKRYVMEYLQFAIMADGTPLEFERNISDGIPGGAQHGWRYSTDTAASLAMFADVLARSGDTSLYTYTTTNGAGSGANSTAGGPKSLALVHEQLARYVNQTETGAPRYAKDDTTNCSSGGSNTLIGPQLNTSNGEASNRDTFLAQANLYFQNAVTKSMYMRTSANAPAYPASPEGGGYCVWCGPSGELPGVLFMFGQMEGVVDPYSTGTPPAPTLTISASPTAIIVGQNSTITWLSTNATSCTASGAWSGTKAISGSELVGAIGIYTLSCTGAGGSVQQSATIVSAGSVLKLPAAPSALRLGALSSALKLSAAGGAPPVLLVADDFNRPDGGLGTNWAGNYTGFVNGQILGSKVRNTQVNQSMIQTWLGTTPGANHFAQVTLVSWNTSSPYIDGGVVLRASASPTASFYYVVASRGSSSTIYVYKVVGGTSSLISPPDTSQNWAVGDVLKAGISGSTIYIYRNGAETPFLTVVDPFALSGTLTGIGSYTAGALNDVELDDFDTGSFTAPPLPPPVGNIYWANAAASSGQRCINSATDPGVANSSQTITQGIGCLSAGDTLMIKDGTYTDALNLNGLVGNASAYYTIRAETISAGITRTRGVVVKATTMPMLQIQNSAYVEIRGIKFDASTMDVTGIPTGSGAAVYFLTNDNHIRFVDNEIVDSGRAGITMSELDSGYAEGSHEILSNWIHNIGLGTNPATTHAVYVKLNNVTVDGNRIEDVAGWGIHAYGGGLISSGNIFRNNFIKNAGTVAQGRGGGILNFDSAGALIYNNILTDIATWAVYIESNGNNVGLYNNTISGNTGVGVYLGPVTGLMFKNNIIYNNGTNISDNGSSGETSNNLTTDPTFVDAGNDDFHLQAGSAAINAGTDLSAVFTTDYDNVTRPTGAPWEIGAYEFH